MVIITLMKVTNMALLRFLLQNPNTRKVFGKRELKIIEKQLYGVMLTQSEKNRLSRDIRKKLEFISKAARFEDEFRLRKGAAVQEIINEARQAISEDAESKKIEEIILYGSAADNTLALSSDIDIAVKFGTISLVDATLFRKRVSGKVHNRVDVQVYNHLPGKIQKEIDSKGKLLYKNEVHII